MFLRRMLTSALAVAALAVTVLVTVTPAQPAAADVNDFSFDAWNIDYTVGLENGRATLHATETITARFPDSDQNRGIVRGLPEQYLNAPTNVEVTSVTDEAGQDLPWELDSRGSEVLVLTGDDDYVRGAQTYVIEYTMDDVVLAAQQTGLDEFYWNLLPADRAQTINNFTATVSFDEALAAELTGDVACYQGATGSTERCNLGGPSTQPDGGSAFSLAIDRLPAGAGATVAIGMTPGTVTQPEARIYGGGGYLITDWDAEYRIGVDDTDHSVMHATETIVAEFPETNRSRGITRDLAATLQRAPTQVEVLSVTDEAGAEVPWRADENGSTMTLVTGPQEPTDTAYLHGEHTFVIEYAMRDVVSTRVGQSGAERDDVFKWELFPRGNEPVSALTARVIFDESLSGALTGEHQCVDACTLSGPRTTAEGTEFTAVFAENLDGEGVGRNPGETYQLASVAIDVAAGAVAQPLQRRDEPVMTVLPYVLSWSGVGLGGIGGIAALIAMRRRAKRSGGTVIAQYEVPSDLPPVVAAAVGAGKQGVEAAQILYLAVNGVIRLIEPKKSKVFAELVSPVQPGAPKFSLQTQRALFGAGARAGAKRDFSDKDEKFAGRMQAVRAAGVHEALARGLIVKQRSRRAMLFAGIALALTVVALGVTIVGQELSMFGAEDALRSAILAAGIMFIVFLVCCSRFQVLTPEGAKVAAHLAGVQLFIKVAEAQRLEMLQSYAGALRQPDGQVDVISVYEKLLPYAMLAGRTKDWSEVLRVAYDTAGVEARWTSNNDRTFAVMLQSVTSNVQESATYNTSSSSGGSTGGGFSGGGGGGGSVGGR